MPTVEYLNYETVEDRDWEPYDDDIFERAANLDLSDADHGTLEVSETDFILDAAEEAGYEWPYSCRTGIDANCAAIVHEGEIEMGRQQILSTEEIEDKNVRLTCVGTPATDEVKLIFNAKELGFLQDRIV